MSEQEEFQPNDHINKYQKPTLTIDIPISPSETCISPEILSEFVKNSKFIDCIKNIESIINKQSKRIDRLEIDLYECRQALTDALYKNNNR